jgi:hypothetical protein
MEVVAFLLIFSNCWIFFARDIFCALDTDFWDACHLHLDLTFFGNSVDIPTPWLVVADSEQCLECTDV